MKYCHQFWKYWNLLSDGPVVLVAASGNIISKHKSSRTDGSYRQVIMSAVTSCNLNLSSGAACCSRSGDDRISTVLPISCFLPGCRQSSAATTPLLSVWNIFEAGHQRVVTQCVSSCLENYWVTLLTPDTKPNRSNGYLGQHKALVGTSHMSDNRQMSVSRKRLIDFMSMVTH
jgi:hypothetical protein